MSGPESLPSETRGDVGRGSCHVHMLCRPKLNLFSNHQLNSCLASDIQESGALQPENEQDDRQRLEIDSIFLEERAHA